MKITKSQLQSLVSKIVKAEVKKHKVQAGWGKGANYKNFIIWDNHNTDECILAYKIPELGDDAYVDMLYITFKDDNKPQGPDSLKEFIETNKQAISDILEKGGMQASISVVFENGTLTKK